MKPQSRKVTRNEQVNLVDLFYYLIGNWYWFLFFILLSLTVAYVRYARMPFVYASHVTAIIKNAGDEIRTARLETYDRMVNTVSVTNEELQLRSVTLMSEVVKALADYVFLRVQVEDPFTDEAVALLARFGVRGFPAIVVIGR